MPGMKNKINTKDLFINMMAAVYASQVDMIVVGMARHLLDSGIKGRHSRIVSEKSITFYFADVPILCVKFTDKGCKIEPLICKVKKENYNQCQKVTVNRGSQQPIVVI